MKRNLLIFGSDIRCLWGCNHRCFATKLSDFFGPASKLKVSALVLNILSYRLPQFGELLVNFLMSKIYQVDLNLGLVTMAKTEGGTRTIPILRTIMAARAKTQAAARKTTNRRFQSIS